MRKLFNLVAGLALLLALLALAAGLTGCAKFTTTQKDFSNEQTGSREITTTAKAYTFIAGKSALSNWKATQTDKTQGASVGSLNQESDATAQLKALAEILTAINPYKPSAGPAPMPAAPAPASAAPASTTTNTSARK